MTQKEQLFEKRLRIGFLIAMIVFVWFAVSSCATEKIDCDAYSQQQHIEQPNSTI